MTLNHSKSWPVVQLRVDEYGRTYSTLTGNTDFQVNNNGEKIREFPGQFQTRHEDSGPVENGENLEKMKRTTVRTDTVSTILEQDTEFDGEHHDEQGL